MHRYYALVLEPDSNFVAASNDDAAVGIWNERMWVIMFVIEFLEGEVRAAAYSHDSNVLEHAENQEEMICSKLVVWASRDFST